METQLCPFLWLQDESCGASQSFHVVNAISVKARHKPNPLWCNPSPNISWSKWESRNRQQKKPPCLSRCGVSYRIAIAVLSMYGHLCSHRSLLESLTLLLHGKRVTEPECCGYKNETIPLSRRRCTGNSPSQSFPPCPSSVSCSSRHLLQHQTVLQWRSLWCTPGAFPE